ncbi:MAG: NADH-quinone oxidoreductase subunit NuoE family protein [Candidatus Aminicenantales bacterium]
MVNVPQKTLQSIVEKHHSDKKNLIATLLDIQEEFHYLSPDSLRYVARALGMSLIDVIGVATFYRAFSLTPRGEHTCLVCMGTACHVRGGPKILEEFERRLDVKSGETTPDGQFTLETVACLGCCAIGPVVTVDGEYFGHTTIRKVNTILKKYHQRSEKAAPRAEESPAS